MSSLERPTQARGEVKHDSQGALPAPDIVRVRVLSPPEFVEQQEAWTTFVAAHGWKACHCSPFWLTALCTSLRHRAYPLAAYRSGRLVGVLPLAFIKSFAFGRFLVSLPYLNWAGVVADDADAAEALIGRAVELADALDVRYLELRQEDELQHPALNKRMTDKVQMRLPLESSVEAVWKKLRSVVRTQVRKAEGQGLDVRFGKRELLQEFYGVFAQNMRDLGTPVYGRELFQQILQNLPQTAELGVVCQGSRAIAAALVVHGPGLTEVPTAAALREFRSTAANSLMYWKLIERAVQRGQQAFDFGRSTVDSPTYVFKKKWGARDEPAIWQYYLRKGDIRQVRPENAKYQCLIRVWQHLPLAVTRLVGPLVVRGIP